MELPSHLLTEVAAGNEAAFKVLFESYREKVYAYLLRVTKSKVVAEEILLDVFLKLWVSREFLQEIDDLDAFIYKMTYNKTIDFFRMASRNQKLQKLISRELESAREKEADHKLLDREYDALLRNALAQLSPQRRLIFDLSRMQGLTHNQIASELQLSRNTVRNTIADTLKSIRQFLQQNDFTIVFPILILCS